MDSKRLYTKMGELDREELKKVKEAIKNCI